MAAPQTCFKPDDQFVWARKRLSRGLDKLIRACRRLSRTCSESVANRLTNFAELASGPAASSTILSEVAACQFKFVPGSHSFFRSFCALSHVSLPRGMLPSLPQAAVRQATLQQAALQPAASGRATSDSAASGSAASGSAASGSAASGSAATSDQPNTLATLVAPLEPPASLAFHFADDQCTSFLRHFAMASSAGATTFKDIKVRIGAARLVLEEMSGKSAHNTVSQIQASALASLIQKATISDVEKADLATLIVEMAWHNEEHSSTVLAKLTSPGTAKGVPRRRRGLQDFTGFLGYGHAEFWAAMQSSAPMANKLQVVCQHLLKLGLRTPSEHTLKLTCSFWIHQVHSPEVLATMTGLQKCAYLKHVKATFDGLRRQCGDPASWVEVLPTDPVVFCQEHPLIFKAVFNRNSVPILSPVDLGGVVALDQSYGCRGGGSRTALPQFQSSGGGGASCASTGSGSGGDLHFQMSPTRGGGGSLERVASQMLGHMQQMASSQQRMFELFLSGGVGGPQTKPLRASQTVEMLEDRPRPKPALAALPPPPPADAIVLHMPAAAAAAAGPADADDEDDLQKMLDAMQDRKRERAIAAKEAAKAKAAAAKATADPTVKGKEAAAAVAAKDSTCKKHVVEAKIVAVPKATTAAAPKAKGTTAEAKAVEAKAPKAKAVDAKASTPPGKKALAGAATPPCKKSKTASPSPTTAAKAKAVAVVELMTTKEKTDARAVAISGKIILGCAKCRHAWRGCGQCRDPAFSGLRWNPFCEM